jgi:hypothetical protein
LSIARKCSSKKIGTQYNTDQVQNEKIWMGSEGNS